MEEGKLNYRGLIEELATMPLLDLNEGDGAVAIVRHRDNECFECVVKKINYSNSQVYVEVRQEGVSLGNERIRIISFLTSEIMFIPYKMLPESEEVFHARLSADYSDIAKNVMEEYFAWMREMMGDNKKNGK